MLSKGGVLSTGYWTIGLYLKKINRVAGADTV